ncbi:MAG: hypothetical protein V2I46_02345, partial [Bacteroides sp.]|jgi:hypothetical protein|nr:hypothetical protein [Bacteroides sp.]
LLPANTYEPQTSLALQLEVDNTFPGGDARTPGYWKNWNTCTGGGQQFTATANADDMNGDGLITAYDRVYSGWALLDDIIDLFGIAWGDFVLDNCYDAQLILDNRDLDGVNRASDPAYNLAKHLLAYQLNQGAGAYICFELIAIETEAVDLLIAIGFDGTGYFLNKPKTPLQKQQASRALELGAILDAYNNNEGCPGGGGGEDPPVVPDTPQLVCPPATTINGKKLDQAQIQAEFNAWLASAVVLNVPDAIISPSTTTAPSCNGSVEVIFTWNGGEEPQTCSSTFTVTCPGVRSTEIEFGSDLMLAEAQVRFYPNPFSDKITFEFVAAEDAHARFEIINLTGQRVAMLMDGPVEQGVTYQAEFSPGDLISQILIYRLIVKNTVQSGRIIYQK